MPTAPTSPTLPDVQYMKGRVYTITQEHIVPDDTTPLYTQEVAVILEDGKKVTIPVGTQYQPLSANQRLHAGQRVIVGQQSGPDGQPQYNVADIDRGSVLWVLLMTFVFAVAIIARRRGFAALMAMLGSLLILMYGMLPQIVAGWNPVFVSIGGSLVCASLAQYLAHGWKARSHLALFAIVLTLTVVGFLAHLTLFFGSFVGLGSEEANFLQFATQQRLNLQGILLAGILLGTLGVLDDVVVAQISVIQQLKLAKKELTPTEALHRGLEVGKDHVASLVNTLILAYAGSSLPLFLLFTLHTTGQPWWVILNSEVIAEEIIRTLLGSLGLVLAVPISTLVATWYYTRTTSVAGKFFHKYNPKLTP